MITYSPSFKVSVNPTYAQMAQYTTQTFSVYLNPYYGWNTPVTLSISNVSGSSFSFVWSSTNVINFPSFVTLKLGTGGTSPNTDSQGNILPYNLTITATGGAQTSTTTLSIMVVTSTQNVFGAGVYDSIKSGTSQPIWGNPVNSITVVRGTTSQTYYLKFYAVKTTNSNTTYPYDVKLAGLSLLNPSAYISFNTSGGSVSYVSGTVGFVHGTSFSTTTFPTPAFTSGFSPPSFSVVSGQNTPLGVYNIIVKLTDTSPATFTQTLHIALTVVADPTTSPSDTKESQGIKYSIIPYSD